MKKTITLCMLAFVAGLLFCSSMYSNTIHSTTSGGLWNNETTWIGGIIPGASDTAVINGVVVIGHVEGYDIYHSYGGWVIVEENGYLRPEEYGGGLGTFILHIAHDIINHGTIYNPTIPPNNFEYLQLNVNGNIYNDGHYRPYKTLLTGEDQLIESGEGSIFGGYWETNAALDIYAGSDLKIDCGFETNVWKVGDFNLNNSTLHLGNYTIDATGTLIYNGTIEGNFGIKGRFAVNKDVHDTLDFIGTVTVHDTLENNVYGQGLGIQCLRITGDIINNGVVRDDQDSKNDDRLNILITGNITNNAEWSCYYVNLIGNDDQYITQANGTQFDSYFSDLDSTSSVRANSDITILQDFNLGRATLYMENMKLQLDGWLYNGYIDNCLLKNASLQNLTSLDDLEIHGTIYCQEGNKFQNFVRVVDTLVNADYGQGSVFYNLIVEGSLENDGVIMDALTGDMLRMYISGDIMNNGIWDNSETWLTGTDGQSFEQDSGTQFGGNFFNLDPQNTLSTWVGDLAFSGNMDLGGASFEMDGNMLSMGGWLHQGTLDNAKLYGGYLTYLKCINGLEIYGKAFIDDSVSFSGNVVIEDTLLPNGYGQGSKHFPLDINGSVINHGVIQDYFDESLLLYINGNITNNGAWENYLTHVYVSNEQYIELIDDKPIEGTVEFDAVVQSETYQWFYDNNILDSEDFEGETNQVLKWLVPVSPEWYGSFYCDTGTKESVGILIKQGNLGVDDAKVQDIAFDVYPNPCQDKITIRSSILDSRSSIFEVIDITGTVVLKNEFRCDGVMEYSVDVSHLPAGLYLVKLQTDDAAGVRKIIKK